MNRFSGLIVAAEGNTSDMFFSAARSSNQTQFDDASSSSFLNNQSSDSESISDDSRKIRKKRNTYHKISDDIRMELLEAVNNGETLKSAAKCFDINYSSAKSILHTYRREGRILKKSAQERNTKKKIVSPEEDSISFVKGPKAGKDRKTKIIDDYDLPQEVSPYAERTASMTTYASFGESSPNNFNENFAGLAKAEQEETEQHIASYDCFFTNNSDFRFPEVQTEQTGEAHNYASYTHNTEDFMSLNSLMGAFQRKPSLNCDFFNDSNAFSYPVTLTPVNNQEKKTIQFDNRTDYSHNIESSPFKSFLETQSLLRDAFRKASIASNNGYRKNSFDMF